MLLLEQADLAKCEHSGSTLESHLQRTAELLRGWGATRELASAARHHTIYSTVSFCHDPISYDRRVDIRKEVGSQTERLVFLYSAKDPRWFESIVNKSNDSTTQEPLECRGYVLPLRHELGFEIISGEEVSQLAAISLANALEQASRLPLTFQEEEFWLSLAKCARRVLPKFSDDSIFLTYDSSPAAKEILELENALKWDAFPSRQFIVSRYDAMCSFALHNLLENLDHKRTFDVPLMWLEAELNPTAKMRSALSPKMVARSIFSSYWKDKDSLTLVPIWMLRQGVAEGILRANVAPGVSADDRHIYGKDGRVKKLETYGFYVPLNFQGEYDDVWNQGSHTPGLTEIRGRKRKAVVGRLFEAFDFIFKASPNSLDWILAAAQVISIREDRKKNGGYGSSSWPHVPGLIGLVNITGEFVPLERVVSGLIHESIHNILYMVELEYPFSVDTNRTYGLTATSPWTGRTLPLASFLHACCVWYGLMNFWKLVVENNKRPSDAAIEELQRAAAGFDSTLYSLELDRISRYIRHDLRDLLYSFSKMN